MLVLERTGFSHVAALELNTSLMHRVTEILRAESISAWKNKAGTTCTSHGPAPFSDGKVEKDEENDRKHLNNL